MGKSFIIALLKMSQNKRQFCSIFFNGVGVGEWDSGLGSRWSTEDSLKEKVKHFHPQTKNLFSFLISVREKSCYL